MISTSGAQLLPIDAIKKLREHVLSQTMVVTPNIPEAKLLLSEAGKPVESLQNVEDMIQVAKAVQSLGPEYVLLKGGHLPFKSDGTVATNEEDKELMIDILYGDSKVMRIETSYQKSKNTHGTGCSLASALACNIAKGLDVHQAAKRACRYIEAGIKTASDLGRGNGPINHFHSTFSLPFAPNHFIEYLLDREDVASAWRKHTEHQFVAGLADGTLPIECFKFYLIQDYLYLIQFARANALASYKAKNMETIAACARIVTHIHHEMRLHIEYCADFGVTKEQMESTEESQACTAYTRYVLDIGQSEDWLALQLAMAPCLIGYGEIAKRLFNDPKTKREGNVYWKWIQNYVAEDYVEAVQLGSALLEKEVILQSPSRIEKLVNIFVHATNMETGFWDMGAGGKETWQLLGMQSL